MNTLRKVLLMICLLSVYAGTAHARVKVPVGEREVLKLVYDLPDTEDYQFEDGTYMDIARLHSEYQIAYILPLYITKEPRLVAYEKNEDVYIENIPEEVIDAIITAEGLDKATLLRLPFYKRYGGKLIGLLLLGLCIYGLIPSKGEKKKIDSVTV